MAAKDSGVKSWGCGNKFGTLSVNLRGSGNSFAPGDWNPNLPDPYHNAKWHSNVRYFRWVSDHQNNFNGGGQWRMVANDTYSSAVPGCSDMG